MSDPPGMLAGMAKESHVTSTDAPDLFSQLVAMAAFGGTRFVITRYGSEMAAVVGLMDLRYLRDRDNADLTALLSGPPPEEGPPPEFAPDETHETLKERIRRGDYPVPRTEEQEGMMDRAAMEVAQEQIGSMRRN